mmetsp:Transcript_74106/g.174009  ORF Transcript_74106/g.174009 Transcript_74106/m.174009 type:complete len:283 (-) Transcript_74106:100-948(-)
MDHGRAEQETPTEGGQGHQGQGHQGQGERQAGEQRVDRRQEGQEAPQEQQRHGHLGGYGRRGCAVFALQLSRQVHDQELPVSVARRRVWGGLQVQSGDLCQPPSGEASGDTCRRAQDQHPIHTPLGVGCGAQGDALQTVSPISPRQGRRQAGRQATPPRARARRPAARQGEGGEWGQGQGQQGQGAAWDQDVERAACDAEGARGGGAGQGGEQLGVCGVEGRRRRDQAADAMATAFFAAQTAQHGEQGDQGRPTLRRRGSGGQQGAPFHASNNRQRSAQGEG